MPVRQIEGPMLALASPENHLRRGRTVCASTGKLLSWFILGLRMVAECVELPEALVCK